jgi:uncharacterized SAM-binding protein YcdF (DUF218 family)
MRPRLSRLVALALVLAALPAALLLVGFLWFVRAAQAPADPPGPADGIVVLTGGPDRVEHGLRLLAAGQAPRLLISGVGAGAELTDLARRAGIDPEPWTAAITLGRAATSTRTNAIEAASWARMHGVRRLIVVTAGFHMPRALAELRLVMPSVMLLPAPVARPAMSFRALIEEYGKWLAVRSGLAHLVWGDRPPPALAAARP